MKQVITLLLITLGGTMSSFGQTMLKVGLSDRSPIKIAVDGRYFNKRGETVTVADLPQGRHYLKIFSLTTTRRGTQIDEVIYEGKIKTYRGQQTLFIYDRNRGMANVTEQEINYDEKDESFNNRNLGNYDTKPDADAAPQQQTAVTPETTNVDNNVIAPLPDGTPLASPVSPNDELDKLEKAAAAKDAKATKASKPLKDPKLEKARKKIAAKTTDTDKLAAAKQVFNNEKLTTAQVTTIISWFDFENSKVDFAKWAYPNVKDKENFKKIKTSLTMKNYRNDMDKFLKTNK